MIEADNRRETGSASVTVHGSSLGLVGMTAMVRSGQTGCESTYWISASSLLCLSAAISRASLSVIITSGFTKASLSVGFSTDFVSVFRAYPRFLDTSSTANESTTIVGAGFGTKDVSLMARFGNTGCESTNWLSDSSLEGMIADGLAPKPVLVVTSAHSLGSVTDSLEYGMPDITAVSPTNIPFTSRSGDHTVLVSIFGSALDALTGGTMAARVGHSKCEYTVWVLEYGGRA